MDAIFLVFPQTNAEVEAVSSAVRIPLMLGGAGPEVGDPESLAACNVRVALQGHLPFQAAVKAVYDTMKALRDGVAPGELRSKAAPQELMAQVTRRPDYDRWIEEFLT